MPRPASKYQQGLSHAEQDLRAATVYGWSISSLPSAAEVVREVKLSCAHAGLYEPDEYWLGYEHGIQAAQENAQ
jgi:hypothetical protein